MTAYVALDLGASSGRVSYGVVTSAGVELIEVSRFPNRPVTIDGTIYWDGAALYEASLDGIREALSQIAGRGLTAVSLGVDSWGVDFGMAPGARGGRVRCYRGASPNTISTMRDRIPAERAYATTGVEALHINTIYQLADAHDRGDLGAGTQPLLVPDLWVYWLTGERAAERSIASTTEMVRAGSTDWALDLIELAGIPAEALPPIVETGTSAGALSPDVAARVGDDGALRVVHVAEHDTASAVVAIPSSSTTCAFISSGSWSLAGLELDTPNLSEAAREAGFTNEQGAYGSTLFMRNLSGLWTLEECIRQWGTSHTSDSPRLADLLDEAGSSQPLRSVVDLSDPRFIEPADLPRRIQDYCVATGQPAPRSPVEITRCILDSLAVAYRATIRQAEQLSGARVATIHLIGGGSRNDLLCALTADACERPVLAGPAEATSLGNILVQAISDGAVRDLAHARALVRQSHPPTRYEPGAGAAPAWRAAENLLVDRLGAVPIGDRA